METQMKNPASRPASQSVDAAGVVLKRWYVIERAAMHALAGWLPGIEAMVKTAGPDVEAHYRRLCRKAKAPVAQMQSEPALVSLGGE